MTTLVYAHVWHGGVVTLNTRGRKRRIHFTEAKRPGAANLAGPKWLKSWRYAARELGNAADTVGNAASDVRRAIADHLAPSRRVKPAGFGTPVLPGEFFLLR